MAITVTDDLDWGQHINNVATKTLGFLRRNLTLTPKETKMAAYKKVNRKVQGMPQSQTAANPRQQEEEKKLWSVHN